MASKYVAAVLHEMAKSDADKAGITINVLYLTGTCCNFFDACNIYYEGHWKGVDPEKSRLSGP